MMMQAGHETITQASYIKTSKQIKPIEAGQCVCYITEQSLSGHTICVNVSLCLTEDMVNKGFLDTTRDGKFLIHEA